MTETKRQDQFSALTTLILVGGQGTRLKSEVNDRPKPMAEIGGRPFLDMVVSHASDCGLSRFVLCTGHMGDFIKTYYRETDGPFRISVSHESKPLGTAGAIKHAAHLIESDPFIVMNGDSVCFVDLHEFYEFHKEKGAEVSMVVAEAEQSGDYGTIVAGETGRIEGYEEKTGRGSYVNAGIYCMDRSLLTMIPAGIACSFERDVFPALIDGAFYAFVTSFGFTDIGTPDRYRKAMKQYGHPSQDG